MAMLILPPDAFLPQRFLSERERLNFVQNRDRFFTFCTPAEQRCLIGIAIWHGAQRHQILETPSMLSECYFSEFKRRNFPRSGIKSRWTLRAVAKGCEKIAALERRNGRRLEYALLPKLQAMRRRGESDVVMGVVNYLRALRVELTKDVRSSLARRLKDVANQCAEDTTVAPKKRIASLIRTLQGAPSRFDDGQLRLQVWKALLEVAEQDIGAGANLVDTHWRSTLPLPILMSLHLHGSPELAYRLAVVFQAQRPEFAIEMMETSILESSFTLEKVAGADRDAITLSMDVSCRMLASWVPSVAPDSPAAALQAIRCVLHHGNPMDDYWAELAGFALEILHNLDQKERQTHVNFGVMAQVAVYAPNQSAQEREALVLFDACATDVMAVSEKWTVALQNAASAIGYASTVLEDKAISLRNRRMPVNPDHPLQKIIETRVLAAADRAMPREPLDALSFLVSLTATRWNELLTRKLHGILRDRFEHYARTFPADAGKALKSAILHQGSSRLADEKYRSDLWQETFDSLIPILARISPPDAAIARSAIGYNPRSDYM